jgi:hypothetical protein
MLHRSLSLPDGLRKAGHAERRTDHDSAFGIDRARQALEGQVEHGGAALSIDASPGEQRARVLDCGRFRSAGLGRLDDELLDELPDEVDSSMANAPKNTQMANGDELGEGKCSHG